MTINVLFGLRPELVQFGQNLVSLGENLVSAITDALTPLSGKLDTVLSEIQALQAKISSGAPLTQQELDLIKQVQDKVDGLVQAGQQVGAAVARSVQKRP